MRPDTRMTLIQCSQMLGTLYEKNPKIFYKKVFLDAYLPREEWLAGFRRHLGHGAPARPRRERAAFWKQYRKKLGNLEGVI